MSYTKLLTIAAILVLPAAACTDGPAAPGDMADPSTPPARANSADAVAPGSCAAPDGDRCGDGGPDCWCDELCELYGDCCADYALVCTCEPAVCGADQCGVMDDGCGGTLACGDCDCPAGETGDAVDLYTGPAFLASADAVAGRLGVALVQGTANTSIAWLGVAHLDAIDAGFQHESGLGGGGSLNRVQGLSLTARPDGFAAAYSLINHTHGTARCVAAALDLQANITTSTPNLRNNRGCTAGDLTWTGDGYSLLTTASPRDLVAEQYPTELVVQYPPRHEIDAPEWSANMRRQAWDGQRLFVAYRKLVGVEDGQRNTEVFVRVAGQTAPVQLSNAPGYSYWPTIASGPDGTAVAWIDSTGDGYVKRFSVLDADAQPRFAPVDLHSSAYYSQTGLALAAGASSYALAWVDAADQVWFTELDGTGAVLVAPHVIETGASTVYLVFDDGAYWAIWQADSAIRAIRICGS